MSASRRSNPFPVNEEEEEEEEEEEAARVRGGMQRR